MAVVSTIKRTNGAVTLQAFVRCRREQCKYEGLVKGVVRVQSVGRRWVARRRTARLAVEKKRQTDATMQVTG
jgi:hypothetical protein